MMNNRNFNDLLHIPTREERLAKFRKSIISHSRSKEGKR